MTEPEELSETERTCRRCLIFGYRFVWATFVSWQLFDFLFSPIWMHGYLWSLNLPVDTDFSDKTAGHILDHQLRKVGPIEKILDSALVVASIIVVLRISGYSERNHTVWEWLRLSMYLGAFSAFARCTQTKQRLFTVLHDIFFIYLNIFLTGIIMTIRWPEKRAQQVENSTVDLNNANEEVHSEPIKTSEEPEKRQLEVHNEAAILRSG
ncbi:unnamed protein product [Bursaphelenchus xylophilus]|uniref:(pine wood nematode) hypothetical protein n=1 Tax=Bursaphelenchus xylophilus TaxID=6326 RepID=A0A1I7RJI8_BURXY|nr:unnamed protein product [Bursaphelenchus xylophilus]CAG9128911.1 unnamed protein product [Bursaphelenchus xylophilus]